MINLFKEDIMDVVWSGVTILVIIIFSRIFFLIGKKIIEQILEKKIRHKDILKKSFINILAFLTWTIAFTLILPEIGIEFSAMIASAGIIGLLLSFGTGNLIKDYFSGLVILFEDHFDIGDEIEVKNFKGKVIDFDLRKTTLSIDKKICYIPNSEMSTVINLSKNNKIKK
ncbi:MAG: mechanosensitive ion channel [Tissierellia bacterium]|nr:mechanosensitive ion channel [Tissierellia bacterium]